MDPFMLMAAKKSQQTPVDAEGLFDTLQGKKRDPLTEATFKGNAKDVKKYSDRKKAAERAQRGDTETLAQKATRTKGTWENAVARARKALKIAPGSEFDSLLKSALWIQGDGKEVPEVSYNEVIKMMQTPKGRRMLDERIKLVSKNKPRTHADNLSFDLESYVDALSRGGTTLLDKNGNEISFADADAEFKKYGITPPSATPKTDEETGIEKAQSVGALPTEGLQGEGFARQRADARELATANISAGAKNPFIAMAQAISPAFKETKDAMVRQEIEQGGTGRDALLKSRQFDDVVGDASSAMLSLGANYGGMAAKGLLALDTADLAAQLPGVWARSKKDGFASTLPELVMTLVAGSATSGEVFKNIGKAVKSPQFHSKSVADLIKAGADPDEAVQVLKAIDELPEEQLQEAVNYTFSKASETTEVPIGIPVKQVDEPAQEAGFFSAKEPWQMTKDEWLVERTAYRDTHQIENARNVGDTHDIDDDIARIQKKYGLTNFDHKDISKLKKFLGKPSSDVTIYRVAPVNELNSGDWVTTDLTYAKDIKRQNGGGIHKFQVKASTLNLPARIEDNPSSSRFSAFQYLSDDVPLHKAEVERAIREGKPVPPEVLADYPALVSPKPDTPPSNVRVEPDVSVAKTADDATQTAKINDIPTETPNIVDDVQQIDDVQRAVNNSEIPNSSIPDTVKSFGSRNATYTNERLQDAINKLKSPPKGGVGSGLGGFSGDELERLNALKDIVGYYIEGGLREIPVIAKRIADELGLKFSEEEIANAIPDEFANKPQASLVESADDVERGFGVTHKETAKIRQDLGMPEYQKTSKPLDDLLNESSGVDVRAVAKSVIDNPRPMSDAEQAASLKAIENLDSEFRNLTKAHNDAASKGDVEAMANIDGKISKVESDLNELIKANDLAGTEWGRSGRARQLEIAQSTDPAIIRYRQNKANGGDILPQDKAKMDGLIDELEDANKAVNDAVDRSKSPRQSQSKVATKQKPLSKPTNRATVEKKLKSPRPKRRIDALIEDNDKALADWQRRWKQANVSGGKRSGSTVLPLAVEGAYYIAKSEILKGVRELDPIIKKIRSFGLTEDDISNDEILRQVDSALTDTRRPRSKSNNPTIKDLRNELARASGGELGVIRKAPPKAKKPSGKKPITKTGQVKQNFAKGYRTTVDGLRDDIKAAQAKVSLLRGTDPQGEDWMKLQSEIQSLAGKVNKGRAYGKNVLQVGDVGYESDEIANLRDLLDNVKRDYGFDDQSINAPGPSFDNIIKNIEDIESNMKLSDVEKKARLKEMNKILNQGRSTGEGFFQNGQYAIESPEVAKARARQSAVMSKINKEIARQKRAHDKAVAHVASRIGNTFLDIWGGIKTLTLSGEAGFIGRQAWTAIGTGRFKTAKRALDAGIAARKQKAFDFALADLKQNPFYQKGIDSGLQISDPSKKIREEDFIPDIFEDMAHNPNKVIGGVGKGLEAYAGLNERIYTAFVNQVRMDLFQEFVEAAGRNNTLTDTDYKALANIVNDMTGKSAVPPKAEQTMNVINKLLISAKWYYSRLRMTTGANLWSGGSKVGKQQMAKEYARMLGVYGTLGATISYAHDKLGLPIDMETDPRSTNFGRIILPNGVAFEFDAGMRPFVNILKRMAVVYQNDIQGKVGKKREPNYVSAKGVEYSDANHDFATPGGLAWGFILNRANPIYRVALSDFANEEYFGEKTNRGKEILKSPVPIILKNAWKRYKDGDPVGTQAMAFALEFFGLGTSIDPPSANNKDVPDKVQKILYDPGNYSDFD